MSLLLIYTTVLTFLVCVGGNVFITPQCNCNHVTDTIDCSTLGLHSVLYSSDTDNSTQLLLPHNHFQHFNICLLMAHLPMVKVIDLRDNDPLLCVDLARQRAPHGLTILSNCRNTTSRTPSSESNRNRTTTQPSDHRVTTTEKSSIKSTVINDPTNKHTALIVHKGKSSTTLVYMYCLISAILIIPTEIITIRWIMRCWKSRRQTRNSPPISLQLSLLNVESDSDNDEENLIFVRASTSV